MTEKWTTTKLVEQFGPLKTLSREREFQLLQEGKHLHIFTVIGTDVGYDDLSEEDRPSDAELEDRGETKDEYSALVYHGCVGHHIVNVFEIFETSKPMPEDLVIEDEDFHFGDDGLPA